MKLIPTPPSFVGAIWSTIKPMVERVVAQSAGRMNMVDTLRGLLEGDEALWVVFDTEQDKLIGLFTAKVVKYDGREFLGIPMVSGERLDEWEVDAMTLLIALAKEKGCVGLEGYGRGAAWARRQKNYGWKEISRTIEMVFDNEQ